MTENAQNLKALEARLNSLRSELDTQIVAVQKRARLMTIVFALLFLFMCGYLTVAYNRIAAVDAKLVLSIVEKEAMAAVDDALSKQVAELKTSAPQHIKMVEDQLLQAPAQGSKFLQTVVVEKIAENLPKLESELNDKIGAAIVLAKLKAQEQGLDLKKPEDFKKFLDIVTANAFGEMTKVVDKVYGEYQNIAGRAGDYLDYLAVGEKLDKRQTLQRQLFISFLMLHQHGPALADDPSHNVTLIPEKK